MVQSCGNFRRKWTILPNFGHNELELEISGVFAHRKQVSIGDDIALIIRRQSNVPAVYGPVICILGKGRGKGPKDVPPLTREENCPLAQQGVDRLDGLEGRQRDAAALPLVGAGEADLGDGAVLRFKMRLGQAVVVKLDDDLAHLALFPPALLIQIVDGRIRGGGEAV